MNTTTMSKESTGYHTNSPEPANQAKKAKKEPPRTAIVRSSLESKIIAEKEIKLDLIDFSPTNPRTIFDQADLIEFGASIKETGLLQAVLVRPHPAFEGRFELVCGERRTRAARAAGMTDIRAVIARLDDEEVFDKQIHENLHRRDLSPIEEAESYAKLLKTVKIADESLTADELARRVCKSVSYVLNRLQLTKLINEAKDDLRRNLMPLGIALELAKLGAEAQSEAYRYIYETTWANGREAAVKTKPVNLQNFKEQIRKNVLMALAKAHFPTGSKELRADALACSDCPERTGANVLFAELAEDDLCLNKVCFTAKTQKFVQIQQRSVAVTTLVEKARRVCRERITKAEEAAEAVKYVNHKHQIKLAEVAVLNDQLREIEKFGIESPFAKADQSEIDRAAEKVVRLTGSYYDASTDVLTADKYHAINTKGDNCKFSETGVHVKGEHLGKQQLVCIRRECQKHFLRHSQSANQNTPQTTAERLARKNELFEIRADNLTRLKVLEATCGNLKPAEFWTNPVFQRLICAVLIELTGNHSTSHLLDQSAQLLGITSKELTPEPRTYQTDADVLTVYDKIAERDDASLTAKLTYLLTTASFGENRHESKIAPGAVEFLVDLFGTDHAALDAASRVELCASRPDYKKFRLEAEEFQKKLAQTEVDKKCELLPPVFFKPVAETV